MSLNDLTVTILSENKLKMAVGPPEQFLRRPATIMSGQNLAAGTVIGRHTESGKFKAYASGNNDGSEVPIGILEHAIDATSADKHSWIFLRGNFNTADLVGMDANARSVLGARAALEFTILP